MAKQLNSSEYKETAKRVGQQITLDEITHMYKSYDMFMESIVCEGRTVWTLLSDLTPGRAVIETPLGMVQLFSEVLVNACDAVVKTLREGYIPGPIRISFQNPYIVVRNEGFPMLVKKGEDGMWDPERAVTKTKTGTNFGKVRFGGGKNGYGFKVLFLFAKYLRLYIQDTIHELTYEQLFEGPYKIGAPDPQPYDGDVSSTEVTFAPDFTLFPQYPGDAYEDAVEDHYRCLAAVASLSCKTPVYFNDTFLDYSSIIDYSLIYFDESLVRKIFYVWPEGAEPEKRDDGTEYCVDGTLPTVELAIIDNNPAKNVPAKKFGITNSILNSEGGIHVDAVFSEVSSKICEYVNGNVRAKDGDGFFNINASHVKNALHVIVSVRLMNPRFNAQSKTALTSYETADKSEKTLPIGIPESIIEEICKEFTSIDHLRGSVQASLLKPLSDLNGKKTGNCGKLDLGHDAHWAGTADSDKAVLIIYEGKSAGQYVEWLRAQDPEGIKKFGLIATNGKIKNISGVTPETIKKLAKNKFFQEFKRMTNIRENVDYTIPRNRKTLRYAVILYAGDSDVDGIHICSLFLNLLNVLYPTLLSSGYVMTFRTKILSAKSKSGKTKKTFYELSSYREWAATVNLNNWTIDYFKGLASSGKKDAAEDWQTMFSVQAVYDRLAHYYIDLFFNKKLERELFDIRRQMIHDYDRNSIPPKIEADETGARYQNISDYICNEYITYCDATLSRHMYARDGLNTTRRKAIAASDKRWKWWTTDTKARVSAFSGYIVDTMHYHHGESLSGVCVRMSQVIVGTTNINYFIGKGQFGSRVKGGSDHGSVRYIHLKPNAWFLQLMFSRKEKPLLEYVIEEGKKAEPKFYLPPVPLGIVQGYDHVMCGYRSYSPPHHLLDVAEWYINVLLGADPRKEELPNAFFRGFIGTQKVVDRRKENSTIYDVLDDEGHEVVDDEGNVQQVTHTETNGRHFLLLEGIIRNIEGNNLTVYELPPGLWTETFEKNLEKKLEDGKIKNYYRDDGYTPDRPVIRVEGIVPKGDPKRKDLKKDDFTVQKAYPLNLMKVLGDDGKVISFDGLRDALLDFLEWRLPYFEKLRLLLLEKYSTEYKICNEKVEYVRAVVEKRLNIVDRKKKDILADIERLNLNKELYGFTRFYDVETIREYEQAAETARRKQSKYESTTDKAMMVRRLEKVCDGYIAKYGDDRR